MFGFFTSSSEDELKESENNLLKHFVQETELENIQVETKNGHINTYISKVSNNETNENNTIDSSSSSSPSSSSSSSFTTTLPSQHKPPLVICHGYGAGLGFFCRNIDALARHYQLYLVDWLGFGGSARTAFNGETPDEAEEWWLSSFEEWCSQMHLNEFYLLGHSLGGYLCTCFALKNPSAVKHLLLASPVGVPHPPSPEDQRNTSWRRRLLIKLSWSITPGHGLRALGPWGMGMVQRYVESRLGFTDPYESSLMTDYVYHLCNAPGEAGGEWAMRTLLAPGAWARRPLIDRIGDLRVNTTFMYGSRDWMSPCGGREAVSKMAGQGDVSIVADAGHHVYLSHHFNAEVLKALNLARHNTLLGSQQDGIGFENVSHEMIEDNYVSARIK